MTLNRSKQRDAIIAFLATRKDHPPAEVVYDNVRETFPNISLGTVYRNLTLLADLGEIRRLRTRDSKDHFDADLSSHYHFICNECFSVSDIFIDKTTELVKAANEVTMNQITDHEVFYYGICKDCQKKEH